MINTQKITKAMKVVAASKLRRATQAIAGARPFAKKIEDISRRLVREILASEQVGDGAVAAQFLTKLHPLLEVRANEADVTASAKKKVGLLVVAADRGLCGAYNSNVLKFAMRRLKELKADPSVEVSLFFVGKRANDFFVKRGFAGLFFEDIWQGRFTTAKSDKAARFLTNKFLHREIDTLEVAYTEFRSAISQQVELKQVLPLQVALAEEVKEGEFSAPYIYEPAPAKMLERLLPKQVQTLFYRILADSLASELGSKMTAMDNATSNAGDMISGLTLQANRVRQASITTELMEIIGGAEALKG